jgi:hypothetical protein
MREIRSSGSVEGVVSDHDPYSDLCVASQIDLSWRVLAGIFAARRHLNATGRTESLL